MAVKREQWGSKAGFVLAAAGSAIGLGNIWKFPYVAGQNGGAAFIIIFLLCIMLIGLPVVIAEILLGRKTQRNAVGAYKAISKSNWWAAVGGMGVLTGFLILSFYCVVAGWSLGYVIEAVKGSFFNFEQPVQAGVYFNQLIENPVWGLGTLFAILAISMVFVFFGIKKGIERGSKVLMPLLFVLLLALMIRGLTLDGAGAGVKFILKPDWSKVNANTVLEALGQAFFTLSLGMGALITYGSYMESKDNVPTAALQILTLDTLISIIAGIAIFTSVFAFGLNPEESGGLKFYDEGLIFQVIPVVFASMPGGYIFSIIFFTLLSIAAITSIMSLLEVVVAYFVDERKWKRRKAVLLIGLFALMMSVPSMLSFNLLSDMKLFGQTFFGMTNYLSSNVMLPLGGFLISVFIFKVWGFDKSEAELKLGAESTFSKYYWFIRTWKFLIKYVAPVLIFIVLLNSIGVLKFITKLF